MIDELLRRTTTSCLTMTARLKDELQYPHKVVTLSMCWHMQVMHTMFTGIPVISRLQLPEICLATNPTTQRPFPLHDTSSNHIERRP